MSDSLQHTVYLHNDTYTAGVLSPLDAVAAAKHGAAAVIVSNHGGRALDGCLSAIEALPAVVTALRADPATSNTCH
jgi:isopentenyl diphosphate isomerase/L-lactate dehydrogenase-like FMN-dependent dehydrogenase